MPLHRLPSERRLGDDVGVEDHRLVPHEGSQHRHQLSRELQQPLAPGPQVHRDEGGLDARRQLCDERLDLAHAVAHAGGGEQRAEGEAAVVVQPCEVGRRYLGARHEQPLGRGGPAGLLHRVSDGRQPRGRAHGPAVMVGHGVAGLAKKKSTLVSTL